MRALVLGPAALAAALVLGAAAPADLVPKKPAKTATKAAKTPRPEEETEHLVTEGETLGGIAARAKIPRVLIAEANGLKPPYAVHAGQKLLSLALALIMGGALGNVIDRIRFGAVVDFVQWHAAGFYWPAFNVADSAITVGAVLMVWDQFFGSGARAGNANR